MARMYPPVLPPETHSKGEQQLYRMLREQLPDDYIVMHGVSWALGGRSHTEIGEIDFLVVHPDLGLVILEVKDQSVIDIQSGRWETREEGRTPPEQMDRNQRNLRQMLKQARITRGFDYEHRVHTALVFTNLVVPGGDWVNRDLLRSQVIDLRDCDQLEQSIRRVAGVLPDNLKLARPAIDALVALLARDISIRAPELLLRLRDSEQKFVELSARQLDVLNMLQSTPRLAIPGCAGSGKTMLAIECAKRLARQGLRVLLTCHTSELAASIRGQLFAGDESGLDAVTVEHFHGLARRLLGDEFQELQQRSSGGQEFWDETVPDALCQRLAEIDERYDAIIADEGQDFADFTWVALEELQENPSRGFFYVFFDSNQRIFSRDAHFPVEISHLALNTNYRNTDPIHELVRNYHVAPDSIFGAGVNGVEPSQIPPENGDTPTALQRLLHRLVNESYFDPHDIVVLTPLSERNPATSFGRSLDLGNFTLTRGRPDRNNEIMVRTIHAFKGMESPVAILVELDRARKDTLAEVVYVGLSRARSQLYIIGELPEIPLNERTSRFRAHGVSEDPRTRLPEPVAEAIEGQRARSSEPATPETPPDRGREPSPLSGQIELDDTQREVVDHAVRPGVSVLVTGGPGSGKSLVLIHAAAEIGRQLQHRTEETPRVLFTTFTNALVRASQQQIVELMHPNHGNVEVMTADRVAWDLVTEIDGRPELIDSRFDLLRLVNAARARSFPEDSQTPAGRADRRAIEHLEAEALLDEIEHVIIARGFESIDEYQAFDPGRVALRLNERQRGAVWRVAREFESLISREGKLTWPLLRRRALDLVLDGHWRDRYDSVVVDEAQDLDLSSLRMLQELCPVHGRFIVSADPNQSIYPVRVDVDRDLASGFNRRVLNTSYRTNREIMEAAREFVASSRAALPPEPDGYPKRGRLPIVRTAENPESECRLIREFLEWASAGRNRDLAHCCVMAPTNARGEEIADTLSDHGIPATWMPGRRLDLRAKAVKVMTLHAAKGLEFQHVAIAGFVHSVDDESERGGNGVFEDDPLMLRKLIYVGMTRAAENLMVIRPDGDDRTFTGIGENHWNTAPGSANPALTDD